MASRLKKNDRKHIVLVAVVSLNDIKWGQSVKNLEISYQALKTLAWMRHS